MANAMVVVPLQEVMPLTQLPLTVNSDVCNLMSPSPSHNEMLKAHSYADLMQVITATVTLRVHHICHGQKTLLHSTPP